MYEIYVVIIVGLVCFLMGFVIGVYRESKDGPNGTLIIHSHPKTNIRTETYCTFTEDPDHYRDKQVIKLEVYKIED